ncbi:hypothetical protein PRZ48_002671 [Zasmidium cellare]|uniref:2EXR domain-containing protein n=1 Tax=Zasmidium cellare TaxID=395010 RepID=A0ABR0ESV5_ZASCE|nr:hypothetical protein PRZ48_002671 [Zasmidium cellare]
MDNSPFNRLPAELRIRIYEFALVDDIFVDAVWEEPTTYRNLIGRQALLETCRQVRQEALPIFYSSCFNFHTCVLEEWAEDERLPYHGPFITFLQEWLKTLGAHTKHLRKVKARYLAWFAYQEQDDILVQLLPRCIREIQDVFAQTRVRVELSFTVRWHAVGGPESTETDVPVVVNPSDLPSSRNNVENALQDEEGLIRKEQEELDFELMEGDIEGMKSSLQRTRRIMNEFFDVLETTDFKT